MPKSVFMYDDSRIVEVITPNDDVKGQVESDARWHGDRLSLEGGKIVIDFGLRFIIESADASLRYAVKIDGREVASVVGQGRGRTVSAKSAPGRPGTYTF
jgi:hypothetical protein